MPKPFALSIDSPKVQAVLADLGAMQRWEFLLGSGRPYTVAATSKRIHSKLGVNNRTAIASRMAGA